MTQLLLIIFFSFFSYNQFSGVFLFLVMFIYMLMNHNLFGVDMIKGDLYGLMGLDYISFYMILLLMWVISLIMILFFTWLLFILGFVLMLSMMVMFISMDFLGLFIYFEFSMIPMLLMIFFMGGYKERFSAGIYMFIYTMLSSLPMLVILLMVQSSLGGLSISYNMLNLFEVDIWVQIVIMLLFLVKVPMFLVHIWLPKAHVEAPVFGSMILASVMLKMGGYGIIRCLDFMEIDLIINDLFYCLCLCGSMLISYSCLYQVDLKILVAYSSVVHMGMMLMGLFSGSSVGYLGGIIMMLSHGICSSGMFYLVNGIYYVSGSRLLMLNKGIVSVVPMLFWMWLLMLINNLGVPPCFGILGELFLIVGCLSYSMYLSVFFFIIVFFVSCFVINMYSLLTSGSYFYFPVDVGINIYYGGLIHLIPLNVFILFINTCL